MANAIKTKSVKKVVTACPHCFNTLKNEYPALGGNYEVVHHTQLLKDLLDQNRLSLEGGVYKGKKITFGEMNSLQKYKIDHRFKAFKKIKKLF
jgi:Fe-S oxidoreductase